MIRVERVSYSGHGAADTRGPILHEVSFAVERGGLCLVAGATGAGKSTLLHLLAGVLRPSSGVVWIDERPVSRFSAWHRDRARRNIGLVPQKLHVIEWLDVRCNVQLGLLARGVSNELRVAQLMAELDIAALAAEPASQLSGGERQRLALARALVTEPPLLLLDEPTAHQDDAHAAAMLQVVRAAREAGATIVVAAHDSRVDRWAHDRRPDSLHVELRAGRLEQLTRKP